MKANGGGGGGGGGGERRGEGEGEREGGRGRVGTKVADSVFISYSYRTRPFAKLFTKKDQCKCHILIYYIFKVTNSLQIKQCLITKKSPSRITRQHQNKKSN